MQGAQKIGVGIVVIGLFLSVTGTAFALFLPLARYKQSEFAVAKRNLRISLLNVQEKPPDAAFFPEVQGPIFNDLVPPEVEEVGFWVKNTSSGDEALHVDGMFIPSQPISPFMGQHLEIMVMDEESEVNSGWYWLNQWMGDGNSGGLRFPGQKIPAGKARRYRIYARIAEDYRFDPDGDGPLEVGDLIGEERMGEATGPMTFLLVGRID